MQNRRDFFSRLLGATLGADSAFLATKSIARSAASRPRRKSAEQEEYEQALEMLPTRPFEALGVPRSWSTTQDGFHPISPERIIILDAEHRRQLKLANEGIKQRILTRLRQSKCWNSPPYSNDKLDLIVGIMNNLKTFYQRPETADDRADWTTTYAVREALGSCGLGHGIGLLHDFQRMGTSPCGGQSR